jgi:hypothetical protein
MSYRGVENWFGNVWKWADGINVHNAAATGSRLYLCTDHTKFASDTDSGYALAGSLAQADGYAKDIIDAIGIYPASVGGDSATYLADYYYTYYDDSADSGWRVALVGGSAVSGAHAGAFCWNSNNGSTYASANIGGRLCY